MHVGLVINYCSWVFALTPCVSPQKMVLLCKLILARLKQTLFIWGASLVAQMVKNIPIMQETWVRSLGQEDPLEKGMAAYASILAWRIPWTEEPGRLQSMGSQRVGHE